MFLFRKNSSEKQKQKSEYNKYLTDIKRLEKKISKYSYDDKRLLSDTQLLVILRHGKDRLYNEM